MEAMKPHSVVTYTYIQPATVVQTKLDGPDYRMVVGLGSLR